MEERSKTNKEIYEQKYPNKKLEQNPMLCAEAVGYLKAIKEYFPSEQNWVDSKMSDLALFLLFHAL